MHVALANGGGGLVGFLRWTGGLFLQLPRPSGLILIGLWYRVIWALSSMEGKDEPSSFAMSWLMNSGHAPLFGLIAFLALVTLPRKEVPALRRPWPQLNLRFGLLIMAVVLGFGVLDEWHQSQVAGRDSSILDILTDLTGAACTLWIAAYLGESQASANGLRLRLAGGLLLCAGVGLLGVL